MIEFYGVNSEECQREGVKRRSRSAIILFSITTVVVAVGSITVAIIRGGNSWFGALGAMVLFGLILIFICIPVPKRVLKQVRVPFRVTITSDTITQTAYFSSSAKPISSVTAISKIKKVVDAGGWYFIVFRRGDMSNSWVCEKSLLTSGTLEEFEKTFAGKIVKVKTKRQRPDKS